LRGGVVHPGDKLLLFPRQRPVRVRALQVHGKPVGEGLPGQRVALGLRDVPVSKLARGMQLGPAVGFEQTDWFTIAIRAVADAPPLDNGMRLRALVGTSEIDTRLRLLDRDTLQPGDEGFAQLRLSVPLAVPAREHVVLRIASPARTVAGGRILEPLVLRRRRNDPAILDRLRAMRDLSPEALLLDAIESAGQRGMALTDLARLCAMRPDVVASRLASEPVLITASGLVFAEAQAERIASRIPIMLELKPSGMSRKQLLSAFDGARAPLVDAAADRLVETKRIERRGRQFVLPDPERDAQAVEDEATLARHLAETLRTSGLQPPNPGALLADAATRRAARRLIGDGIVIRAVDRAKGRELLFHRDAIAQARAILGPLLAQGDGLLVTSIAAALGVSRKFAMPLLDHLDKIRFTRREGNMRFAGDALQGATDD
jgi:selenocysteine-specific elongation factor